MQVNKTKTKLQAGELVFGLVVTSPDPNMVDLAGVAGMDFVRIDCQHGAHTLETVEHMARAAEAGGVTPLARIPNNSAEVIVRHLDRGLAGLIFPRIATVDEARAVVRHTKFAPLGERTYTARGGLVRWTAGVKDDNEHEFANRETLVICLAEDAEGYRNIEKIAEVPGVDMIMVGHGDLAQSMGHLRTAEGPEVRKVVDDGIRRVRKVGKPVGLTIGSGADVARQQELIGMGVQMFNIVQGPMIVRSMRDIAAKVRQMKKS